MAGDRYYSQLFKCKCGAEIKQYVWESALEKHIQKCHLCSKKMKPFFEEPPDQAPGLITGKFKKGRPPQERKARREKSFKEEVLPTLSGFEKKHFNKKFGYKSL